MPPNLALELEQLFGPVKPGKRVRLTSDLARIKALPRRTWQDHSSLPALRRAMTEWLKYQPKPCSEPCEGCRAELLTPAQTCALAELKHYRRLAGLLRTGAGKTLVSFLAATVLEARKPVLVVPASQVPKTTKAYREYCRHWRVCPIKIVSYSWLGHSNQLDWLAEYQPDLLVLDEAHKVKNPSSKVWKRIRRYTKAKPACTVVPLTGTPASRSLRQCWHWLRAALGEHAPVPSNPFEAVEWALALDAKVSVDSRLAPGPLLELSSVQPAPDDELAHARLAFGQRLTQTPGVVSTLEDIPDVGLGLACAIPDLPPVLVRAILDMRRDKCTPAGQELLWDLELWQHARNLGCGLVYYPDPPPPESWRLARREWFRWVGERLARVQRFDSVVHLTEEVHAGKWPEGAPLLARWLSVKDTYTWVSKPHWVDDTVLTLAGGWLDQHQGLCWVEQRAFGERLSELTSIPFFSRQGLDPQGLFIQDRKGPAIASIAACRDGLNLQYRWHRNLITSPPSTGEAWEQLLARTHRDGQTQSVTAEVVLTSRESYQSLAQAIRDAQAEQALTCQPRKLCYAQKNLAPVELLVQDTTNALWATVGV